MPYGVDCSADGGAGDGVCRVGEGDGDLLGSKINVNGGEDCLYYVMVLRVISKAAVMKMVMRKAVLFYMMVMKVVALEKVGKFPVSLSHGGDDLGDKVLLFP